MKRNAIIRIIVWSIVLIALISILAGFITYKLYLRDYTAEKTVLEEAPLSVLPNEEELTFPTELNEIEIEWIAGDIVIMAKDIEEIVVFESDVSDEKYSLLWNVQGNRLEILFCEEQLVSGFGISNTAKLNKDLYIYVPMDWEAKSLEVDAASANMEIHNISAREIDFDGASGTCDFHNCNISDLDIDTASGDVNFTGTLDTLDFDAASASFIGDLQNTPSRIDMDSMSGSLDLALPEDCGFTLSMDGMSSRFNSDFYGTRMQNGSHVYGDGRCRINVDGMSCDVSIRKLDTVIASTIDPTEETIP